MNRGKLTLGAMLVLILLPGAAYAQSAEVGKLAASVGKVEIKKQGANEWKQLPLMGSFQQGATIRTAADSRARLLLADSSVILLGANSELEINEFFSSKEKVGSLLTMFKGKMLAAVTRLLSPDRFKIEFRTPTAVAGVRGTYFYLEVSEDDGRTAVMLMQGKMNIKNIFDSGGEGMELYSGQSTLVMPGVQPSSPAQLDADRFNATSKELSAPFYITAPPSSDMKSAYADALLKYAPPAREDQSAGVDPSAVPANACSLMPPVQQEAFPPATPPEVPVKVIVKGPNSSPIGLGR